MRPTPREVDDEFVDYVRARQHQLLRAAYLVCGDEALAEDILESALGALSLRWGRAKDDNPDELVRRILYREAMSRRPRHHDGRAGGPGLGPVLERLTPKQRAVAVLLHFEERSEVEAAEVLGMSTGSLHHQDTWALRDDLEDTAGPVAERDFVDRARRGARSRRQRSRRLWLVGGVTAALLVGGFTVVPRGEAELTLPRPAPSDSPSEPSPSQGWDASQFMVAGARAQLGPSRGQLGEVPPIDDLTRSQLALPQLLGFGPDTKIPTLTSLGGDGAPVRAVLLRHTEDGLRAVLVRPTLSNPYVLVDTIPLVNTVDEGGNTSEPLEVKAIADDRRHVMFVQPSKVVVLDAFTGDVRTIPVPDAYLEQGGWAGASIVVSSETLRWRVSPDTGVVRRVAQRTYPGRHQVVAQGDSPMRVLTFDERGLSRRTRVGPSVLSGVWGATFTSPASKIATGGFLSRDAAQEANEARPDRLFQGIFTIDAETLGDTRLLIAPGSEGLGVGCCEVLGWAFADQVLVRWRTSDLLIWQVSTGALRRVATLPSYQDHPVLGTAAVSVALAP